MKKKIKLKPLDIVLIVVILSLGQYYTGKDFPAEISYAEGVTIEKSIEEEILETEKGFYSKRIPIFANEIEILEADEERVLYKVSYFPFGNIERSYSKEPNGEWVFNLEKSLTGIN